MRKVITCSFNTNKEGSKGDYDTPSKVYTNSVSGKHSFHPGGQHALEFYTKCVMLVRLVVNVASVHFKEK